MRMGIVLLVALIAGGIHQVANAYVGYSNVTIAEFVQWQDASPIFFKLSNGAWCYVPAEEKNLYVLLLSMHAQATRAEVHCHDTVDTVGGLSARRVHRVWTAAP